MQMKIVFISDKLEEFHSFVRQENLFEYRLDLYNHLEASRRNIYQTYYDLFIIDLAQPWLTVPHWLREQAHQHYFFQVIFLCDGQLNSELENLLGLRITKVLKRKDAAAHLKEEVDRARQNSIDHKYRKEVEETVKESSPYHLVGNHPSIKRINEFIQIVSRARYAPCLIRGETGSGRHTCAQMIHRANNLRDDLFFIKDCAGTTINEFLGDLFGTEGDSELYGPDRRGLLEIYNTGTLVLDNIECMPREVQDKILLYLDDRVFKVLGSNRVIESNVRILALTRHNLEWFVQRKNFNSSLFYHLNAFEIQLPALRERLDDILYLARYYIQYFSFQYNKPIKRLTPGAERILKDYTWPGNVRELRDVIERAVFISTTSEITNNDLPKTMIVDGTAPPEEDKIGNCSIKELERLHIERVLTHTNGNKSRAAGILDISRTTLREKMKSYGLQ